MVDYCPEEEDTFLIDPAVSTTEAAKYHVVFFDKGARQLKKFYLRKGEGGGGGSTLLVLTFSFPY